MISIEEAYRHLAETYAGLSLKGSEQETVPTDRALNRALAEDITCRFPSPPFNASAMDGIAYHWSEEARAFRVIGTVAAGDIPDRLQPGPGECVRIMTGAPVPSGADTVQMVERVAFEEGRAELTEPCARGSHIRYRGENLEAGASLYAPGTVISPGVLAGLLSNGIRFVKVRAPLRIGIAATGNEVIDFRRPLQPGQIYNSNALTVGALLQAPNVEILQLGTFPDRMEETVACIAANTDLDLIVLTGGVSMGNFDLVPEAAETAGFERVFHKIRMKPGKPLWFGKHSSGCLFFGLPGNPVSAVVGTMLYVKPMVRALLTGQFREPAWCRAVLTAGIRNRGRLPFFVGAEILTEEGSLKVNPIKTSGSGDVLRFSIFETLLRLNPETEYNSGDGIQVLLPF
ncbi:MAG: molybdopterin molybdotransferase MoeA [Acidobacteriota bacterium]|nr:molybdopterin molybdotransferase MoeA [Acidobacteriota bacterium]